MKADLLYDKVLVKLNSLLDLAMKRRNIELALELISSISAMHYSKGSVFRDDMLENCIESLSQEIDMHFSNEISPDTVLFYDSFGEDTRGIALIYLLALARLKKKIIYITSKRAEGKQESIDYELKDANVERVYFPDEMNYLQRIHFLIQTFNKYTPAFSFSYIYPWDVAGVCFFTRIPSKRIKIDLTDHKFWLGKKDFDYLVEFRQQGVSTAVNLRKINVDRISVIPFYPYINNESQFLGFDFDVHGKRIIFSGGALYKTFSPENTYYKIVDHCLTTHKDVIFYYAGNGDYSKLEEIKKKHPNRVYYSAERKDFLQVIKKSVFYLNTYPFFGGLMTQYAVVAGRVPVTLLHPEEKSGILLNEDNLGFLFHDFETLISSVDRMLNDKEYLQALENQLREALISEDTFNRQVQLLLDTGKTDYERRITDNMSTTPSIEKKGIIESVAKKNHKKLMKIFPIFFIERVIYSKVGWKYCK